MQPNPEMKDLFWLWHKETKDVTVAAILTVGQLLLDQAKPIAEPSSLLNIRGAAHRLNVSVDTVRTMVATGKLAAQRVGSGRGTLKFSEQVIEQYLQATDQSAPKPSTARRARLLGIPA